MLKEISGRDPKRRRVDDEEQAAEALLMLLHTMQQVNPMLEMVSTIIPSVTSLKSVDRTGEKGTAKFRDRIAK